MDRDEYYEILAYARERASEIGRADLDPAMVLPDSDEIELRRDAPRALFELLHYLDALQVELRLRSAEMESYVLADLNSVGDTNEGPIDGVDIETDLREQITFDAPKRFALRGSLEASASFDELIQLRARLVEEDFDAGF